MMYTVYNKYNTPKIVLLTINYDSVKKINYDLLHNTIIRSSIKYNLNEKN